MNVDLGKNLPLFLLTIVRRQKSCFYPT